MPHGTRVSTADKTEAHCFQHPSPLTAGREDRPSRRLHAEKAPTRSHKRPI